jgi:rod shape-determining protein MreC
MLRSRLFIIVTLLVVAFLVSLLSNRLLLRAQEATLTLFSPLFSSTTFVKKKIGGLGKNLMTLDQLDEEYRRLLLENKKLLAENDLLHGLEEENTKLRAALNYQERSAFRLLSATVIARDHSAWWNTIKINRGSKDGLTSDMAVITDRGLVGKTTTVTDHSSVVMIVTDEACKVAAKVEGTREQGIESGLRDSTGDLQLCFLDKLADLKPGQKVYTAGVSGGVFPSGIELGTVKSFQIRELDGRAILDPAVDLNSLEDLFVIVGAK